MNENLAVAFSVIDLTGVVLNGILGGMLARQHRFDAVGFAVLAIISALGGGMVRDVLLDTRPVALTDPWYLICALTGATVAFVIPLDVKLWRRLSPIIDAIVLGVGRRPAPPSPSPWGWTRCRRSCWG